MEREERRKHDEAMDDFWDIDALIPPRRAQHYAHNTDTAEIVLEPLQRDQDDSLNADSKPPERHYIPPYTEERLRKAPDPDRMYEPQNSLITSVRLYKEKSQYRYYEDFVRDAKRLYAVKGVECPHVPFFSYVPQYSQMNRGQLEWYLWWRENFRRGEYLSTDYSYLLLYAYEVINLSDKTEPEEGQNALCSLWLHYRDIFHQLDGNLPEWICDYSLMYQLPPPSGLSGQLLLAAISRCALKEFYITASGEEGLCRGLPVFCSNYDFHKSKFCTEENRALFERLIVGALLEIGRKTSKDGKLFGSSGMDASRMVRSAFSGALCAYHLKYRIAVEYTSFSCSHELRYLITDIIKYTENRIRAHLGIRSRLSVYALSVSVRKMLDAYLDPLLPRHTIPSGAQEAEIPEYEKLYDLPKTPLSFSAAAQIERDSWDTTSRLVEAFEEADPSELPTPVLEEMLIPPSVAEITENNGSDDLFCAIKPYLRFLRAALSKDGGEQRALAQEMHSMPDVIADTVNELCAECTGDILLEECDGIYVVIEDYRSMALDLIERKDTNV